MTERTMMKPVTITPAAAERIRTLMENSGKPVLGVRLSVSTKGCSGLSYDMQFVEERQQFDEVVEEHGVTLFVDPKATMFLFGTEMDYVEDKLQSGFVFRNPNEKGRCGCGESFTV